MTEYYTDNRTPLLRPSELFIDGEWAAPASGDSLELISPSDEAVHARVAAAGVTDIDRAVAAARQAFDSGPWPRMTPAERAALHRKMAELLRTRAPHLAAAWSFQTGVPTSMAT